MIGLPAYAVWFRYIFCATPTVRRYFPEDLKRQPLFYFSSSNMSTVKNISVTYDAINETNTFSSGDSISGRITVELAKDCTIKSMSIKAKGKADVLWTERHGQTTVVYHAKNKYFSMKRFLIQEERKEGML